MSSGAGEKAGECFSQTEWKPLFPWKSEQLNGDGGVSNTLRVEVK